MRVAIVLNTSWNIYNFRLGLLRKLLELGHEVHTVAPHDRYTEKLEQEGCIHHDVKMDSRGANPIKDFLLTFELYGIYKHIKPDVVLQYTIKPNIYGTFAAYMLGIPMINNVCGLGTMFLNDNLVSKIALLLYKVAFRFPKKIFFQNNDDLDLFISKALVQEKKCDLLPGSGINTEKFIPSASRRKGKFTFLVISRLIYDKGVVEYVEAVRKVKETNSNVRFQLLGAIDEGHKRGIPKKLVEEWIAGGVIEYLGTSDDVRTYINDANCVVLPSYREGTPRTLLEAASMGIPLIGTDVPGCRSVVVNEYNGLLCEPKSSEDLAEKMARMLTFSEEALATMGKNGRYLVESTFDEKIVIDKYVDSIKDLSKN